jgi:hypothetical protein
MSDTAPDLVPLQEAVMVTADVQADLRLNWITLGPNAGEIVPQTKWDDGATIWDDGATVWIS